MCFILCLKLSENNICINYHQFEITSPLPSHQFRLTLDNTANQSVQYNTIIGSLHNLIYNIISTRFNNIYEMDLSPKHFKNYF